VARGKNWHKFFIVCSFPEGQTPRSLVDTGRCGTWKELAQVLDRLFFWLMLMAMTLCSMIVLLAPAHKHFHFTQP